MTFNYRLFVKQLFFSVFKTRNTNARLTPKRVRVLALFSILFPFFWSFGMFCLLLDHLLFGGFRRQEIKKPVFILGNFRSGSTLLHRLLSRDSYNFITIKSWEIYAAPSISQRKFFRGLKLFERLFGSPFLNRLKSWEERELKQIKIHRTGIWEPEEDEGLFLYIWYSLFVWFFFPDALESARIHHFDEAYSGPVKRRFMRFYRACIKRHLYAHLPSKARPPKRCPSKRRPSKLYLTKNPSLTGRVDALLTHFPDAKIIYLVRNPLDTVSSQMGWFSFTWHYFADPVERYPFQKLLLDMAHHWYHYPPKRLEQEPEERYAVVTFDQLTQNLEEVVTDIYHRFDLELTDAFRAIIHEAGEHSRAYSSKHSHALQYAGLDPERIIEEFEDIFDRYGFRKDIR